MRTIISLFLCLTIFKANSQQEGGIRFVNYSNWNKVLQKAMEEGKYIFVDCYATWCAPCKWMDKNVYALDSVGKKINLQFISVKVQMDTSKLDDNFIKSWYQDASFLKDSFKVASFPTYLFFSPLGKILHRGKGSKKPNLFLELASDALDNSKAYYSLIEKLENGTISNVELKTLARTAVNLDNKQMGSRAANEYINRLSERELFKVDNIKLMYEFTRSSKNRGFNFFKNNMLKVASIQNDISLQQLNGLIYYVIYNEEIKPYLTLSGKQDWILLKDRVSKYGVLGDSALLKYKPTIVFEREVLPQLKNGKNWKSILNLIDQQNLGAKKEFLVGSTIVFYYNNIANKNKKSLMDFIEVASYYEEKFPSYLNSTTYNDWAWLIFEHGIKKEELNIGLRWAKRSVDIGDPNLGWQAASIDTYANLLYKLGNVKEALIWEEKAIKIDPSNKSLVETIEKMKKGIPTWPRE